MQDAKHDAVAQKLYDTMIKMLKAANWKFDEHPEDLAIVAICKGEDIPMSFYMQVVEEKELVIFRSKLPFAMAEDKRIDASVAVCVANFGLSMGGFQFDIRDGELVYVCGTSYTQGCELDEEFFRSVLVESLHTIDVYNDRFLMLNKGFMTLQQFIEADGN